MLATEDAAGVNTPGFYTSFQARAERVKDDFVSFLIEAKRAGKTVADGTVFPLEDGPQKGWLQWSPEIKLPSTDEAMLSSVAAPSSRIRPDLALDAKRFAISAAA